MTPDLYKVFQQPETVAQRFNGYILAERCAHASPDDRKLIFSIQAIVLREKSLEPFLVRFKAAFPNAIRFNRAALTAGATLTLSQIRAVESETGWVLPVKGIPRRNSIDELLSCENRPDPHAPASYSECEIRQRLSEEWESLRDTVTRFCLADFDASFVEPWWWTSAKSDLQTFIDRESSERQKGILHTSVGAKICETLDLALATKRLVVLDGSSRIGKTFALKAWCEAHVDEAVYVQTPSKHNEQSFLTAILEAVGIPVRPGSNMGALWARLEMYLRITKRMIVFDEGHWLISPGRYTIPHRLAWILTAVVNQGCPCAIVTTPQFLKAQEQIATRTNWNAMQFIGRILVHQELGDIVPFEEMVNVVKNIFPGASEAAALAVATYAEKSHAYMEGIGFTADIARNSAQGREVKDADIRAALKRLNRSGESLSQRLQTPCKSIAKPSKIKIATRPEQPEEYSQIEPMRNRLHSQTFDPVEVPG